MNYVMCVTDALSRNTYKWKSKKTEAHEHIEWWLKGADRGLIISEGQNWDNKF